jgi:hypothetical protein
MADGRQENKNPLLQIGNNIVTPPSHMRNNIFNPSTGEDLPCGVKKHTPQGKGEGKQNIAISFIEGEAVLHI